MNVLLLSLAVVGLLGGSGTDARITYTLHLGGVSSSIANQISDSVSAAVNFYNAHGLFKKHLNIYYNAGVPTAQANYGTKSGSATMTFGGSRNTRVALHEILHTIGIGTTGTYQDMMRNGNWTGAAANAKLSEFDGSGSVLRGDSVHIWPYGLNYDSEDSSTNRLRHVQIVEAVQCDIRSNEESCKVSSINGNNRRITGRASGRVLDASTGGLGANVQLYDHWGPDQQRFDITSHGSNIYSFRARTSGNRALDVYNWSSSNGGNIVVWDWTNGNNQRFYVEAVSGTTGWYTLRPQHASGMCVQASGSGNNANVIISSCDGGEDQHWAFHT